MTKPPGSRPKASKSVVFINLAAISGEASAGGRISLPSKSLNIPHSFLRGSLQGKIRTLVLMPIDNNKAMRRTAEYATNTVQLAII